MNARRTDTCRWQHFRIASRILNRGEGFIISLEKNLFFTPNDDSLKGSVINFVAHHKHVELREAASLLKTQFLSNEKEIKHKREIPNLTLEHHDYILKRCINPEVAKEYEVGFVKQRSIVAGRIAFKTYDHISNHIMILIGIKANRDFFTEYYKR